MADVAENAPITDPAIAISQGKRHLLVRDYGMAVAVLAEALEILTQKHGDLADELGEPYLLYGRALLGLAREEAGVLGDGIAGSEDAEEEEEEDAEEEDGDEEKQSNADEKDEEEDDSAAANSNAEEKDAKAESKDDNKDTLQEKNDVVKDAETGETVALKDAESKDESKPEEANKTDDSKIAERKAEDKSKDQPGQSNENKVVVNGESSKANGDVPEANGDQEEDLSKDENNEANNLQIAWEVLELAKLILLKRGPSGWKGLAEAYRLLGEIAMEDGNHERALVDLQGCLDLLGKIEPCEPRAIAEIHYQLGLAHSLANDFDASIEQFKEATTLLESRIKQLEETTDAPKSDNPFYTIEGEIKELKELLPEIQEKIADMKDFKEEACKVVLEGIKNQVARECRNGAGTSGDDGAGSSASGSSPKVIKPASDISHLVRKKRKAEETETETASPLKKPTPEKIA